MTPKIIVINYILTWGEGNESIDLLKPHIVYRYKGNQNIFIYLARSGSKRVKIDKILYLDRAQTSSQ